MEALLSSEVIQGPATLISKKILSELMQYRRFQKKEDICGDVTCIKCINNFLVKILAAVEKNEPIIVVLPAFPGKSPNPEKVLGPLPDQAEMQSLFFLSKLSQRIQEIYNPGMKVIICSDGRVFSDVVGMIEENVTAYQSELKDLIREMDLRNFSTFNLDDHFQDINFHEMRESLMQSYSEPLENLQLKIRNGAKETSVPEEQEASRMYCGITRFLFEDSLFKGQTQSKTALQKSARIRAYEVIRRSNAWSALIANRFPSAIRLSIHPQSCGSKKLGIRLIANESWMTPWHGVAVKTKTGFRLMKRFEAEALGARLINDSRGRPSYFSLETEQVLLRRPIHGLYARSILERNEEEVILKVKAYTMYTSNF